MKNLIKGAVSLVLVLALLFPAGTTSKAITGPLLSLDPVLDSKLMEKLEGAELAEVIITFHGDEALAESELALLQGIGLTDLLTFENLPMAGAVVTKDQVDALFEMDDVLSVYLNEELTYYNADSRDITRVDEVRSDEGFKQNNGGLPVTGEGVGVLVNDSGVDGTHEDHKFGDNLVQNVLGTFNLNSLSGILPVTYLENVPNTDTNSGHGTHVAGTVGGTGAKSDGKYEGVAPGADLIGYGSGAVILMLDGIGGFDYALANQERYGIQVITNSWGSSGDFDPFHPINIASKQAYDAGIVVLFAAGNEGPEENTHNPYAKAPWVISVAAGNKDGTLADFSSRGTEGKGGSFEIDGEEWEWKDEPTLTAPGVDIISTRVIAPLSALAIEKDLEYIDLEHIPYYTTMSGTSMATPHVAGIVALMLEANPDLSPDEVKTILQDTASEMEGRASWEAGAGYADAYEAVRLSFQQ
ncbi:S8 family serine peptidase [Bacillus sp. H-16]|uniref:S8 family serine peptidase n=1 Tax=Alteribacter salitolerans TaxID=2912333 RepID=UPI0019651E8E|nr:S8 family serine peptidase [Alteribacter salitolerans]MBM7096761.1 S8 family serine peptidase [Alteribacter salitolerans]